MNYCAELPPLNDGISPYCERITEAVQSNKMLEAMAQDVVTTKEYLHSKTNRDQARGVLMGKVEMFTMALRYTTNTAYISDDVWDWLYYIASTPFTPSFESLDPEYQRYVLDVKSDF